jgi:hypothetical protein
MRTLLTLALAACLLTSCRSNALAVAATIPSPLAPTPTEFFPPTPAVLPRGTRIIIQSANLSLTVDDPAIALARIEGAVMELGGLVASSNSWSSPGSPASSSLSARVPRDSLPALRRVAIGLSNQIQSDGTYSQDVTPDHRRLLARLRELERAEGHLLQLLTHAPAQEQVASLLIAHQMIVQERTSIEAQLAEYEDRATYASFDVTLNGPSAAFFIE